MSLRIIGSTEQSFLIISVSIIFPLTSSLSPMTSLWITSNLASGSIHIVQSWWEWWYNTPLIPSVMVTSTAPNINNQLVSNFQIQTLFKWEINRVPTEKLFEKWFHMKKWYLPEHSFGMSFRIDWNNGSFIKNRFEITSKSMT